MTNEVTPSGAFRLVYGLISWLDFIGHGRTNEKETCGKPGGNHGSLPKGLAELVRYGKIIWQFGGVEPATLHTQSQCLTIMPRH